MENTKARYISEDPARKTVVKNLIGGISYNDVRNAKEQVSDNETPQTFAIAPQAEE